MISPRIALVAALVLAGAGVSAQQAPTIGVVRAHDQAIVQSESAGIVDRILAMLINEAADAVHLHVPDQGSPERGDLPRHRRLRDPQRVRGRREDEPIRAVIIAAEAESVANPNFAEHRAKVRLRSLFTRRPPIIAVNPDAAVLKKAIRNLKAEDLKKENSTRRARNRSKACASVSSTTPAGRAGRVPLTKSSSPAASAWAAVATSVTSEATASAAEVSTRKRANIGASASPAVLIPRKICVPSCAPLRSASVRSAAWPRRP